MQVFKIVMIEDSDAEAATLIAHLERFSSEQGIRLDVTRFSSALEFAERRPACDLIFMDIDLPGLDGMQAAQELRETDPDTPLMFVTNLAQYAVHGYAVDALDFMVKPVEYYDFSMRMMRALREMRRNAERSIVIGSTANAHVVSLARICRVELIRHDLVFHLAGAQEPIRMRGSIAAIMERLPEDEFLRISQGCVVNMSHIARVRNDGVELDDGSVQFFSRSRKRACLEMLTRFFGGSL